jgi:hypothetical protein
MRPASALAEAINPGQVGFGHTSRVNTRMGALAGTLWASVPAASSLTNTTGQGRTWRPRKASAPAAAASASAHASVLLPAAFGLPANKTSEPGAM